MTCMHICVVLFGAFLVIIAECAGEVRSRKNRELFLQPLPLSEKRRRTFLRGCIATAILLLSLAFVVVNYNCSFEVPKDGIAIVIDESSLSPERSSGFEKNVAESFTTCCRGIPLSLYELRGGAIFSVCPPTIDRIFFRLQLGSISSSRLIRGTTISLNEIEDSVCKRYETVSPWVVVISANNIPVGSRYPKATACVSIYKGGIESVLYGGTKGVNVRSLDLLAKEIRYRLLEAQKSNILIPDQMLVLIPCITIAYVLFLYWKSRWSALHLMVMTFLFFNSSVFASEGSEANVIMQNVIDLAEKGVFSESEKTTTTLLNITSSHDARARLVYDCALLLYLRGNDVGALNWIAILQSMEVDKSLERAYQTLKGMILIRRLKGYSSLVDYNQSQTELRNWLSSDPIVSVDLIDAANLALLTTRLQEERSISFTIHWIQNALIAMQDQDGESLFRCVEGITTETNGVVLDYLKKFFSLKIVEKFIIDVSHIKGIVDVNKVYLWYYLAGAHTVQESIDYLFQEGCTILNRSLYFPFFRKVAEANIPMIEELLSNISDSLTEKQKEIFDILCADTPSTFEMQAAYWYARRVLWPTVSEEGTVRFKELAVALTSEMNGFLPLRTRRILAQLAACIASLPLASPDSSQPLEFVLNEVFEAWYGVDKLGLFEFILTEQKKNIELWNVRLEHLLSYSIQKDAGYSALCEEISRILATDSVNSFDLNLLAHFWQIGLTLDDTTQLFSLRLCEMNDLLKELHAALAHPSDEILKTFCLIYQVMPNILKSFREKGSGYLYGRKKETYDELLFELVSRTQDIQSRIAKPSIFRLPKVREEVVASATIVLQMMALFSETNESFSPGSGVLMNETNYVPSVLRAESAITLFQELDRSDRELFGD